MTTENEEMEADGVEAGVLNENDFGGLPAIGSANKLDSSSRSSINANTNGEGT